MTELPFKNGKIKVAVVTGNHVFDVPQFIDLFRSMDSIDFYIQDIENYSADMSDAKRYYDVTVFYNLHGKPPDQRSNTMLERLGETDQGIFLLHHGILSYREWHIWAAISGITDRKFTYHPGELIRTEIADPDHPITRGLEPWEMLDETYKMDSVDPDGTSHILLKTIHPKSLSSIAWTRQYRNAPVFCYASGHGQDTYVDPNFRTVVERGIQWLASQRAA